jgi:mannose-1-phosphate guanylyltransferase/mannose-6-phosphate isomerase
MTHRELFVLSGGAGTRLWPMSRESYPKQFYDLAGTGNPLLIDTVGRLSKLASISVITTEALRYSTLGLLLRNGHPDVRVVGEPIPRNTAAAVALATWMSLLKDESTLVGVFPADHFIQENGRFTELVELAFHEAKKYNEVVTIGVHPEYAATGFGYMELDQEIPPSAIPLNAFRVKRFVEKPSVEAATKLINTQRAVWNAGMFIFPAKKMASHFETLMPKLWQKVTSLKTDLSNLFEIYPLLESQSVDCGIMEKLQTLYCLPGSGMGWSDVGSWEEVAKKGRCLGAPIEVKARGNFYTGFGSHSKRVAFVGVDDLAVVDTPDALMIVKKGYGQDVKEVVSQLKFQGSGSSILANHVFEERPWGRFEVLMDTPDFKSKRISVWPGHQLSYQSHQKRSEHWVIVKGQAEVTLDGQLHSLKLGDHIFIPAGCKHRLANLSQETIEFIEVQTGTYFGEDDIVRYFDNYGRAPANPKP